VTEQEKRQFAQDLGLGGKMADRTRLRLVNKDGSFNVRRNDHGALHPLNLYHTLLSLGTGRLLVLVAGLHVAVNALFATLYWLGGPGAIDGAARDGFLRWEDCFFFSVQTIATIGYGRMTPATRVANLLVSVEALLGLLGFAVLSALLFARFARPAARIAFSAQALIAPYQDGWALMMRLANRRRHDLTAVEARVSLAFWVEEGGRRVRRFRPLELERPEVMFLPLHWVLVHPIDAQSPLRGWSPEELRLAEPEVFVLISADDETFAQKVHARTSYRFEDLRWGAKFADMYVADPRSVRVDLSRLDKAEEVAGPERL
jgi:inward rectifier potassium channel